MSPLRRRMIEDVMVRNPSPATCQSYLGAVKALHHWAVRRIGWVWRSTLNFNPASSRARLKWPLYSGNAGELRTNILKEEIRTALAGSVRRRRSDWCR